MTHSARSGLTWIETLIIIAIVLVVVGMLMPPVRRVREAAARMSCSNNLKQLMLAFHNYHSTFGSFVGPAPRYSDKPAQGVFPPGCIGPTSPPEERLSWMVALLPYVEQDSLYRQFDLEETYAESLDAAQTRIKMFVCPAFVEVSPDNPITSYVALSGIGPRAAEQPAGAVGNGFMGYDRLTSLAMIKDGTSNTIALMETQLDPGAWARGGPSTLRGFDPVGMSLRGDKASFGGHSGVINAAMADGSVRAVLSSTDPKLLAGAITIAGGEPANWDW